MELHVRAVGSIPDLPAQPRALTPSIPQVISGLRNFDAINVGAVVGAANAGGVAQNDPSPHVSTLHPISASGAPSLPEMHSNVYLTRQETR